MRTIATAGNGARAAKASEVRWRTRLRRKLTRPGEPAPENRTPPEWTWFMENPRPPNEPSSA